MHRCSQSSHGNPGSKCSCGLFIAPNNNSFSMLFSMPKSSNHHQPLDEVDSYPVDCTLSLGTPSYSSRQSDQEKSISHHHHLRWNIFQTNKKPSSSTVHNKSSGNSLSGGDPLLTRRCTNCDTTSTPLWRNGPRGPKSLCNACGIRYKKEERRATTAIATTVIEPQQLMNQHHHQYYSWAHHHAKTQTNTAASTSSPRNEFRFNEEEEEEEEDRSLDTSIPLVSWSLNVRDSTHNLFHDYT